MRFRSIAAAAAVFVALALLVSSPTLGARLPASGENHVSVATFTPPDSTPTATPIKHLVIIFQENVSFDHYFATYPHAGNLEGERPWAAASNTPNANGLGPTLLTHNPNEYQPVRLSATQALTCDMNHDYTAEQQAEDRGLMDKFVQSTTGSAFSDYEYCPKNIAMGYYDGNTTTALWNYAQHFAMSDNSFGTTFGPSTPGALNLAAADTGTAVCGPSGVVIDVQPCGSTPPPTQAGNGVTAGTVYSDADPYYDDCSKGGLADKGKTIAMAGTNVGDLLNTAGVEWGWFQGGFDSCLSKTPAAHGPAAALKLQGVTVAQDPNDLTTDYSAHHEPFQYYASTSNPHHLPPTGVAMIGQTDQANHQYDLHSFWKALDAGVFPSVVFLKARRFEDGHAGYSDPLDEQHFLVRIINRIERSPDWRSTAIVINYDDSDGWYDHVFAPIVNHSDVSIDNGCGTMNDGAPGRCGYGPRLPLLVISPFARSNFVDHTLTDQSSILKFIEDNWLSGQRISRESFDNFAGPITNMFNFHLPVTAAPSRRLILDGQTGVVVRR